MTDWILLAGALVLLLLGLIGGVLPVLPGPPLSFAGMILLHLSRFANFSTELLWIFGFIAVGVQILDYIVPAWGTKKFGGTKYGTWGSVIGLIVGVFILPSIIVLGPFGLFGIIAGPFFGALIGEKIGGMDSDGAMKAAFGSFIGFLAGTFMKVITSIAIIIACIIAR